MKGKLDLKIKAKELRIKGLSIKDIKKKLGVSLSSVSLWVRDVKLTDSQLRKLYENKRTGNLKGSIIAAKNKIKQRELITSDLKREGRKEIGKLSKRDRFIVGVTMYAGEGGKTDRDISFVNSDSRLIKFMMGWFRDFCHVLPEKFRGSLYIHDNLDEKSAKQFWSKLTGIPLNQFTKSYIVKNNKNRLRNTKHENGIFRIKITNANLHRKIIGWVDGILD
jgi:predicted transcriptional regulator